MATLVLTVIGDDQSGLVDRLSKVVANHGGNWHTSHMARLAGKFAGIVMISVGDHRAEGLIADLAPLEAEGLLDISVEQVKGVDPDPSSRLVAMELVGLDQPGIVHDVSHALAKREVSIEELRTETYNAPMAGGTMFRAEAVLRVPSDVQVADLERVLEELASNLMVEIELDEDLT